MKGILRIALILSLVLTLLLFGLPAGAADEDNLPEYAPDRILVKFKSGLMSAMAQTVHSSLGGEVNGVIPNLGVHIVNA